MTQRFSNLPPELRNAIRRVCTPDEQDVLHYIDLGYGSRRIARALNINRDTARARFSSACRKLEKEVDHLPFARQDPT